MKQAPAPQGVLVVLTGIVTFVAGVFLSRGEVTPAVAMLIVLAAVWVLAAMKSA